MEIAFALICIENIQDAWFQIVVVFHDIGETRVTYQNLHAGNGLGPRFEISHRDESSSTLKSLIQTVQTFEFYLI